MSSTLVHSSQAAIQPFDLSMALGSFLKEKGMTSTHSPAHLGVTFGRSSPSIVASDERTRESLQILKEHNKNLKKRKCSSQFSPSPQPYKSQNTTSLSPSLASISIHNLVNSSSNINITSPPSSCNISPPGSYVSKFSPPASPPSCAPEELRMTLQGSLKAAAALLTPTKTSNPLNVSRERIRAKNSILKNDRSFEAVRKSPQIQKKSVKWGLEEDKEVEMISSSPQVEKTEDNTKSTEALAPFAELASAASMILKEFVAEESKHKDKSICTSQ